ncbi:uncharacterized protein [Montipora foliosa]|uniref:uncharacterized protein n=1 Tax=Montipora foliosa TaxID=591990 RepID=UPI0035F12BA5
MYDTMDWTLRILFHEETNDMKGLDNETKEGLRRKCLTKVTEILVLVIMAASCLTLMRLTLREQVQEQNRKSKPQ